MAIRSKILDNSRNLGSLIDAIDEYRLARESLEFSAEVYQRYATGGEPANEHMDVDKARVQLLDAVFRLLKA